MIYSILVKKVYKSVGISPLLLLLNSFCLSHDIEEFIVCLPGYLGKNKITLSDFYNNFPKKTSKSTTPNIGYFFSGMNGSNLIKLTRVTCQNYINSLYGSYSTTFTEPKDHSKVAVFFWKEDNLIVKKNIDNLIKNGKVFAILIGSSNQSHQTYIKSPADKGECDILLIDGDIYIDSESPENEIDNRIISIIENLDVNNDYFGVNKEIYPNQSLENIKDRIFNL